MRVNTEQVETLLKGQDPPEQQPKPTANNLATNNAPRPFSSPAVPPPPISMGLGSEPTVTMADMPSLGTFGNDLGAEGMSFADTSMGNDASEDSFPWEMIGLGLEEPLPPQDTIDDLYALFSPARPRMNTDMCCPGIGYTLKKSTPLVRYYIARATLQHAV